jgi:hypothetical protein
LEVQQVPGNEISHESGQEEGPQRGKILRGTLEMMHPDPHTKIHPGS